MKTHTLIYQETTGATRMMLSPDELDATPLFAALCELRRAWRDGNGVFDVRTMQAVGAVIAETEEVTDFDGE